MSSSDAYWGNSTFNAGTFTISNDSGTEVVVGGFRGATITPAYEHEALYTADSTFRDTVKRYEHNVNVDITYAYFAFELAQEWLGGDGATATASQDDADPAKFKIEAVSPSAGADGATEGERTVVAEKVVFPEMPVVDATQDEYEEYELSGTGRQVSQVEDTSGA